VKISKHLGYLKARGLVRVSKQGNWRVYALPPEGERTAELAANLACLQDCVAEQAGYKRDRARLKKLDLNCAVVSPAKRASKKASCCG
jgi:ArsR family transcriptional regulator